MEVTGAENLGNVKKKKVWLAFKYFTQWVNQKIILNLKVIHVIIKMTHFELTLPDKCFFKETLMPHRKLARLTHQQKLFLHRMFFKDFS